MGRRSGTPAVARRRSANFTPPDSVTTPTSVRALDRVSAVPFLLGLVLTVLLFVSSGYLLTTSVRGRRRDLAVLWALGADDGQLRAVVHWQATLVAACITAVGVPLGILAGRWVVSSLTEALGIVPGVDMPIAAVLGLAAGALVVANGLAVVPAWRVVRAGGTCPSLDH